MEPYIYKDSGIEWQGDVPRHWIRGKLFRLCDRMGSGGTPLSSNEEYYSGDIPWIQSGDLNDGQVVTTEKSISESAILNSSAKVFPKGTLLVAMYGATIGKLGIMEMDAATNQACCALQLSTKLKSAFMYYQLLNMRLFLIHQAYGGTQPNISQEILKQRYFYYPPHPEQQAIATYLDQACARIDRIIGIKEEQLNTVDNYMRELITQCVTQGMDESVALKPVESEWVEGIPRHWEVKQVKRICKLFRGKFTHRPRNDPEYYDGEYPFIQTGSISQTGKYITEYTQTLNEKGLSVSELFPSGTLAMTIAANVGDVAILTFDACFPDSIVGFRPNHRIDLEFLYYVFKGLQQDFLSTAIVTTQLNLNITRIGAVNIYVPPIDEQRRIVQYLERQSDRIETLKVNVKQQIETLKSYRKSLIHECVTGKKQVVSVSSNFDVEQRMNAEA